MLDFKTIPFQKPFDLSIFASFFIIFPPFLYQIFPFLSIFRRFQSIFGPLLSNFCRFLSIFRRFYSIFRRFSPFFLLKSFKKSPPSFCTAAPTALRRIQRPGMWQKRACGSGAVAMAVAGWQWRRLRSFW
jgi:hypothetical protein